MATETHSTGSNNIQATSILRSLKERARDDETANAPPTAKFPVPSATSASGGAGSNNSSGSHAYSWEACFYCQRETFKSPSEFVQHLRARHCTREGGSFVCRYGFNGVCPSLPLDGVSDRDYDAHVAKYHVNQHARESPPEWSVFSAAQNLPAVLNDPSRGKQTNLFTKKWGDSFVEKTHIPHTPRLPDITPADFEKYLSRIGKRYRRHERMCAQLTPAALAERERSGRQAQTPTTQTHTEASLSAIPDIFLREAFDLNRPQTFAQVFPGIGAAAATSAPALAPGAGVDDSEESKQSGRVLQEKLSHYLDIVEMKIAQQVAQKSSAFFHAMTSQDTIMAEMQEATAKVRQLRASLKGLHESMVVDSFRVMRFALRKQNHEDTLDKLRLMATVHKTQPMLQLLLGTQDYVAALDLIGTTQEILTQELIGIHCFKHLPMQLTEMEKLIDKMLTNEFERYATADLNRPLSDGQLPETDSVCAEEDKLVCIVMGLLRKKNFAFVEAYKDEAIATIRTIIKQLVIEVIASSDAELCLTGAGEEAQSLSIGEWIALLEKAVVALLAVLQRIKTVTGIMQQTADAAAGVGLVGAGVVGAGSRQDAATLETSVNLLDAEAFLAPADHVVVREKLHDLLTAVCNYCHERCANLVTTQSLEKALPTVAELEQLAAIVDEFCDGCEEICGHTSVPLKLAVKVQASRFANRFHGERKQKLALLLDSERWRQVDIPHEFQKLIDRAAEGDFRGGKATALDAMPNGGGGGTANGHHPEERHIAPSAKNIHSANPILLVEGKPYTLVGAALLLVQMMHDYCRCAAQLPLVAGALSRNVIDLLRTFNSRSCQLIIGAGAMRVAGLKTITSTNLALVSRALQLVLWLLPHVRAHFQAIEGAAAGIGGGGGGGGGYDSIERDYHSHIKEIEHKITGIVAERVLAQLEQWDARPPIPSQPFRNISRHLVKLHEAIAPILPEQQMHSIYGIVHRSFKDKLREQLLQLNVINNGGPQHGVVTSELTFYMETLRTLRALPAGQLDDRILEDIWTF